ncbi:MAG: NAD(P)H-hydrate epimerase [Planctomycetes bacterium]|nr:NAD(P)H-hydrate epimerase [Planctomycetota bacterium]
MKKYEKDGSFTAMTRQQVRSVDRWAIEEIGIAGVVLMENAGRSCAELAIGVLGDVEKPSVTVFCGVGNNGGDGYVIARHLLNNGFKVTTVICADVDNIKGDAKTNLDILHKMNYHVEIMDMQGCMLSQVSSFCSGADMVIDCIFGTGLAGELRGPYQELITAINEQGLDIMAVDIPSGLDCDTGEPLGTAIEAMCTVTFVAVKKGFTVNESSQQYTGEIFVADIGIVYP